MIVIRYDEVSKYYPEDSGPVIDHVSLEVNGGEIVVLFGPSGCGKTTLLKMTNRLVEPSSGRIFINGTDAMKLPVTNLRRHIGYVIQQVGLFPHMTVMENISVVPELLGWDANEISARVKSLFDLVGLPPDYARRYPRQLSGGEQQRVGLARALAADPSILLMDEPFGAIDAITRDCLQEELVEIQRKLHKTILFVTHDVEEALRLADKIAVFDTGRLIQYGTPMEILTHPMNGFVQELFGARDLLRRLSLIKVQSILDDRLVHPQEKTNSQIDGDHYAADRVAIRPEDDLRLALIHLLDSQASHLVIEDDHGRSIGNLDFNDLRRALIAGVGDISGAD